MPALSVLRPEARPSLADQLHIDVDPIGYHVDQKTAVAETLSQHLAVPLAPRGAPYITDCVLPRGLVAGIVGGMDWYCCLTPLLFAAMGAVLLWRSIVHARRWAAWKWKQDKDGDRHE